MTKEELKKELELYLDEQATQKDKLRFFTLVEDYATQEVEAFKEKLKAKLKDEYKDEFLFATEGFVKLIDSL